MNLHRLTASRRRRRAAPTVHLLDQVADHEPIARRRLRLAVKRSIGTIAFWLMCTLSVTRAPCHEPPGDLQAWLGPQDWQRDTDGPVLSLGESGSFDDRHMFAPCAARLGDEFLLWYCGSRGEVGQRVFRMGLARSSDGREFIKAEENPVFDFGDGKHSVLTPTLLRATDGTPIREDGRLRMWFSATHFAGGKGLHTLRETASRDGTDWSQPSEALLENVYAPSILKDGDGYRMWYTDVSSEPWVFRHATSPDGRRWTVTKKPVLVIDQDWEQGRLFYPCVVKVEEAYLLWYGSYWRGQRSKTAIGFAASSDGIRWHKHPNNPVLKPDESRPWESHYTTSQSVMRLPDGTWRMWYASRKKPPHVNKYFAIGAAAWKGPGKP